MATGTRTARWTGGFAGLAGAVLLLTGCGDSGSPSRGASAISGPTAMETAADETTAVELGKKKGKGSATEDGKKKGKAAGSDSENGKGSGKAKGRPRVEVRGQVSSLAGSCPVLTFQVAGLPVRANGVTRFHPECPAVAEGVVVEVKGQPLGNGTILAREIKVREFTPETRPAGFVLDLARVGAAGSPILPTESEVEDGRVKFEFKNVPPGTYELRATVGTTTTCPLATGITIVAPRNEVEGAVVVTASPPTACDQLILQKLEVKQGVRS